jgi:hypothetical protein
MAEENEQDRWPLERYREYLRMLWPSPVRCYR